MSQLLVNESFQQAQVWLSGKREGGELIAIDMEEWDLESQLHSGSKSWWHSCLVFQNDSGDWKRGIEE